jgi:hypothetical protein
LASWKSPWGGGSALWSISAIIILGDMILAEDGNNHKLRSREGKCQNNTLGANNTAIDMTINPLDSTI